MITYSDAHQIARFDFIITELELALTFCQISLESTDGTRSRRNAENARRAYQTALHFLERATFTRGMNQAIRAKVKKLEPLMARLPQRVAGP